MNGLGKRRGHPSLSHLLSESIRIWGCDFISPMARAGSCKQMGSEEELRNEAGIWTTDDAPSPSVGAIPLSSGLITLKWEEEMLFN